MNKNEVITLQFGNYSNFIGAHWWNIQEASFIYSSNTEPEIDYDVLFREGKNLNKEITYTPRLLFVDLNGSTGGLPQWNGLYENTDISSLDVSEDGASWSQDKIEIEREPEYEKNEFLQDLEKGTIEMKVESIPPMEGSIEQFTQRYELNDKVKYWSDYLGVKFHPRSFTIIKDYQHNITENAFNNYAQGVNLWRTNLFVDEWTDNCRAYAEECDTLQGFQVLFDSYDGFSGLSCSALTYIQDEYSGKSVFAFPNIPPSYSTMKPDERLERLLNSVLSIGELPELSSAFVPLCVDANAGLDAETPRQFHDLCYDNKSLYHSSALLASFLDSASLTYRLRKNTSRMSSLLTKLSPCGRKLLSGSMRLPFPLYAGFSVLESLEKLEEPYWTSLTPKTNITMDSAPLQEMTVRGLSSFALLPGLEKRTSNPAYSCESVAELFTMYFDYCSTIAQKGRFSINSYNTALKIPKSFPSVFIDEVTRIGCIASEPMPLKLAVVESPMLTGLHNCPSVCTYLNDLCEEALKVKPNSVPQFSSLGFEPLEFKESIEKLLTLKDNYE